MIDVDNADSELFRMRCEYGKTQGETADGSGISRTTINRIETGKLVPENLRAVTFFKLNEFFKSLGENS